MFLVLLFSELTNLYLDFGFLFVTPHKFCFKSDNYEIFAPMTYSYQIMLNKKSA